MNLENIDKWILPFSAIIVTIFYSFSKIREMNAVQSGELIKTLKEEVAVQKEKNERLIEENRALKDGYQQQMNELNKQLGELRGRIAELSKQNETQAKILQGRSPEQEQFMKFLTEAATASNKVQEEAKEYMANTQKILEEISFFMKDLHNRNQRVDKLSHKGGVK